MEIMGGVNDDLVNCGEDPELDRKAGGPWRAYPGQGNLSGERGGKGSHTRLVEKVFSLSHHS